MVLNFFFLIISGTTVLCLHVRSAGAWSSCPLLVGLCFAVQGKVVSTGTFRYKSPSSAASVVDDALTQARQPLPKEHLPLVTFVAFNTLHSILHFFFQLLPSLQECLPPASLSSSFLFIYHLCERKDMFYCMTSSSFGCSACPKLGEWASAHADF